MDTCLSVMLDLFGNKAHFRSADATVESVFRIRQTLSAMCTGLGWLYPHGHAGSQFNTEVDNQLHRSVDSDLIGVCLLDRNQGVILCGSGFKQ